MWMSPLVTAVHRVIFNLLSSLGELIHTAFLKGKDGLDIVLLSHHARTKCQEERCPALCKGMLRPGKLHFQKPGVQTSASPPHCQLMHSRAQLHGPQQLIYH